MYSRKGSRRSYGITAPDAIAAPVMAPTMAPATAASSAKAALGAANASRVINAAAKIRVSIVISMTDEFSQRNFEVALPIVNKTLAVLLRSASVRKDGHGKEILQRMRERHCPARPLIAQERLRRV